MDCWDNKIQIKQRTLNKVVRSYSPLHNQEHLAEQLEKLFPEENLYLFSKLELQRQLNDLVLSEYLGEHVIKYALFKDFQNKDIVGAFEMRVGSSRADFLSINGESSSFEIKSGLDTLQKLSKQAADYLKAFDFNYIVIDAKHLEGACSLIPESFGIWSFSDGRHEQHRPAILNQNIDPEMQLRLLTKREKQIGFKNTNDCEKNILIGYSSFEINTIFKNLIKQRYIRRWNFLLRHAENILPIDLQFFFNCNIDPHLVYNQ